MKEHDALAEGFTLAHVFIRARADLTQEQVAERMAATQAVIAHLESGRVTPTTRSQGNGHAVADRI